MKKNIHSIYKTTDIVWSVFKCRVWRWVRKSGLCWKRKW